MNHNFDRRFFVLVGLSICDFDTTHGQPDTEIRCQSIAAFSDAELQRWLTQEVTAAQLVGLRAVLTPALRTYLRNRGIPLPDVP